MKNLLLTAQHSSFTSFGHTAQQQQQAKFTTSQLAIFGADSLAIAIYILQNKSNLK